MSEEWKEVKSKKPISEGARNQALHPHVQLWMCKFITAIFLTMVPPMYLPKKLGKKHLLKGYTSLQYSSYSQLMMEQRGHLVMTCPFILEELQGAAVDYLINGIFHRDF